MKLSIRQTLPPTANGVYTVRAPGCLAASLYWGNADGKLEEWTPFAYIPIMPNGEGTFIFERMRAIPSEATHVYARAIHSDMITYEEGLQELPYREDQPKADPILRCVAFSDLHLSAKDWKVRRALKSATEADCILLAGDMTNDGTAKQLARFHQCVKELLPGKPVFSVTGNHDILHDPIPQVMEGIWDYYSLQDCFLQNAEQLGWKVERDASGAYAASMGKAEIIGLNAVSHWRRFVFDQGGQLDWLEDRLKKNTDAYRIILCHAPLFDHAFHLPKQPYLNRNKQLQSILDTYGNVIYLSGHTHYSPNSVSGCAQKDPYGNIYINTGSVCPTLLLSDEALQPEEWTEGNGIELSLYEDHIEVTAFSPKSQKKISRGYYWFEVINRI